MKWPRQTCHESRTNRIGDNHEHDRNRAGFTLQRGRHRSRATENHVGLEFNQFFREGSEVTTRPTNIDLYIAAVQPN
jgi:hypothetical protein